MKIGFRILILFCIPVWALGQSHETILFYHTGIQDASLANIVVSCEKTDTNFLEKQLKTYRNKGNIKSCVVFTVSKSTYSKVDSVIKHTSPPELLTGKNESCFGSFNICSFKTNETLCYKIFCAESSIKYFHLLSENLTASIGVCDLTKWLLQTEKNMVDQLERYKKNKKMDGHKAEAPK